jgi:hypothetical protein
MAVAFDAVGPSSAGTGLNGTSSTWSHTCTGVNRLLTVGVAIGLSDDTNSTVAVTYNGVSMTSAGLIHSGGAGSASGYVQIFYLLAPATGANTVLVSHKVSGVATLADIEAGSVSFTGVDQVTPVSGIVTNGNIGASGSVSVTSAVGNMVVDAFCCGSGFGTGTSGQTNRWLTNFNSSTAAGSGAQSTAAGTSSVSMSYTFNSDSWGLVAMNVSAVVASAIPVAWLTA